MPGRRAIRVLVVGWASFLPAVAGAAVFFAAFDPAELARHATFPMELGRMAGYALGFLGFWVMTAMAASMAVFLER